MTARWLPHGHLPAAILGIWAATIWHLYVVACGTRVRAIDGALALGRPLEIASTAAVGAAAWCLTRWLVAAPARSRIAVAEIPRRIERRTRAALGVMIALLVLGAFDHATRDDGRAVAAPPPATSAVVELDLVELVPVRHTSCCGQDPAPCR